VRLTGKNLGFDPENTDVSHMDRTPLADNESSEGTGLEDFRTFLKGLSYCSLFL
jgi:hypothetical protein